MKLFDEITSIFWGLFYEKKKLYDRSLPFGDYFVDRWDKARKLGFGAGSSVYDNVIILGDVKVGEKTWVGPNVVLDGSGGLEIGSNCSISAGVQIYSHDSVNWAVSGGVEKYEHAKTSIGNNCYLGPNVVVQRGVTIGNRVVVGASSFVNKDIPDDSVAVGSPVKIKLRVNSLPMEG